jgi:hypothetical protein
VIDRGSIEKPVRSLGQHARRGAQTRVITQNATLKVAKETTTEPLITTKKEKFRFGQIVPCVHLLVDVELGCSQLGGTTG